MKTTGPSLTILAVIMFALLASACDNQGETTKQKKNRSVVVLKAYSISLAERVEALGTAQASESITITARVAGRLEDINFSDGQMVKKGHMIARMDQDEQLAQLVTAEVQLAEHQREIKRLRQLLARKAVATRTLDERKTLAAITASSIKEIKARLNELTLTAPFAGRLGIRRVSPGAMIQPGTVITTLDAADIIHLDFTIASTQLTGLTTGTPIEASSDVLPAEKFSGTITSMDSRIDPLTRSMLMRAEIDNREAKLIPGMLMRVVLHSEKRQSLVVPEESITQQQDKHFLTLVAADGRAEIRPVETGLRERGLVEIRHGLAAGERVVVRGMGFVKAGQMLNISETWDSIRDSHYPADEAR